MIGITVYAADLLAAIQAAGIVTPKAGGDAAAGFHIRVASNGDGFVYSRDDTRVTKAPLTLQNSVGSGSFVLPSDMVKSLNYVSGLLSFTAETTAPWKLTFSSEDGATSELSSLNPALIDDCESELEDADGEPVSYLTSVLQMALKTGQDYVATNSASAEPYKTFKLWDATDDDPKNHRGNGVVFCTDERRGFYFQTPELKDRGLILHARNQPAVLAFLAQAGKTVSLRKSDHHYFLVDGDRVLGWVRDTVSHTRFTYYPLEKDNLVLKIPKDALIKAVKYMQAGKPTKFRWTYQADANTLQFVGDSDRRALKSPPVACVVEGGAHIADFSFNADVDHTLELFDNLKGNEVMMRILTNGDTTVVRTIEEFWLDPDNGKLLIGQEREDSVACRVTRVMPSKVN